TLSGSVDENAIPYKAYMKLSILEMEKFRRGKEKQSALGRVHHIDQRFRDIEVERQKIVAALESNGTRRQRLPGLEEPPTTAPRTTTGPFKIRY
ncbi:MAG: hypothetical protein CVU53_05345, partial [Deltaproteobacteria bacterium HGW-Deltaproteobacteria-11]